MNSPTTPLPSSSDFDRARWEDVHELYEALTAECCRALDRRNVHDLTVSWGDLRRAVAISEGPLSVLRGAMPSHHMRDNARDFSEVDFARHFLGLSTKAKDDGSATGFPTTLERFLSALQLSIHDRGGLGDPAAADRWSSLQASLRLRGKDHRDGAESPLMSESSFGALAGSPREVDVVQHLRAQQSEHSDLLAQTVVDRDVVRSISAPSANAVDHALVRDAAKHARSRRKTKRDIALSLAALGPVSMPSLGKSVSFFSPESPVSRSDDEASAGSCPLSMASYEDSTTPASTNPRAVAVLRPRLQTVTGSIPTLACHVASAAGDEAWKRQSVARVWAFRSAANARRLALPSSAQSMTLSNATQQTSVETVQSRTESSQSRWKTRTQAQAPQLHTGDRVRIPTEHAVGRPRVSTPAPRAERRLARPPLYHDGDSTSQVAHWIQGDAPRARLMKSLDTDLTRRLQRNH